MRKRATLASKSDSKCNGFAFTEHYLHNTLRREVLHQLAKSSYHLEGDNIMSPPLRRHISAWARINIHTLTDLDRSSTAPTGGYDSEAVRDRHDYILDRTAASDQAVQVPREADAGAHDLIHGTENQRDEINNHKDHNSPANLRVAQEIDDNQGQGGNQRKRDKAKPIFSKMLQAAGILVGLGGLCELVCEEALNKN
jgi:hypothetical protein